jgi:hypothetical protein
LLSLLRVSLAQSPQPLQRELPPLSPLLPLRGKLIPSSRFVQIACHTPSSLVHDTQVELRAGVALRRCKLPKPHRSCSPVGRVHLAVIEHDAQIALRDGVALRRR